MELKALCRLEDGVGRIAKALDRALERQRQLSAALVKSSEEVDKLRGDLQRYRAERTDTRKKVDALLKRFDTLEIDLEQAEQ